MVFKSKRAACRFLRREGWKGGNYQRAAESYDFWMSSSSSSIFFLCFTCSIFFFLCACFNHALTFRFVFKASVGAFFYNSVDLDDVRRWRWLRKRKRQRQRRCQLSLHAVIREAAAAATTTTMLTHLEYVERDSPAPSIRPSVRLIDQLPLPSK